MKKLNSLFSAAIVLSSLLLAGAAQAQQKIGVVNVQAVFQALPQAAMIQQDITNEFREQLEEVNRLEKDIKYYLEKQQRDAATMSETEKQDLQKQIIDLRNDYQGKAQPLQQNVQRRQAEERDKLLEQIKVAIDELAAAEKYDMVLNATAVVYMKGDADNLSQKIIDKVSKSE